MVIIGPQFALYPSIHNHNLLKYSYDISQLKKKCKTVARTSQNNLRKIFGDVVREEPFEQEVTLNQCESSMYRSRRRSQPKIPSNASNYLK